MTATSTLYLTSPSAWLVGVPSSLAWIHVCQLGLMHTVTLPGWAMPLGIDETVIFSRLIAANYIAGALASYLFLLQRFHPLKVLVDDKPECPHGTYLSGSTFILHQEGPIESQSFFFTFVTRVKHTSWFLLKP